jgi:phospholipid/cholesterol/gamma-HCH transport system permease protein
MADDVACVERALKNGAPISRVQFETRALGPWDFALVTFLAQVEQLCAARKLPVDRSELPAGVRRLLELTETSVRRVVAAKTEPQQPSIVERTGAAAIRSANSLQDVLEFIGELTLSFGRFITGRARYLRSDLLITIQSTSASALGIVALISYLVGVILAFMGAVQLSQFGASIYVADLVAIGTVREMGAMMTAIIMAGRTGAAFAAQLGTMKVRQEVEALQTMGIAPMEFLVLPRVIALVLMMPLLCLYSDFLGILGGATIGVGMLHLSLFTYLKESAKAIYPSGVFGGLFKSLVYGILIAIAGCYQGMKCGNSAAAVGEVTTAAVVDGIVLVVVACGLLSLVFHVIGI